MTKQLLSEAVRDGDSKLRQNRFARRSAVVAIIVSALAGGLWSRRCENAYASMTAGGRWRYSDIPDEQIIESEDSDEQIVQWFANASKERRWTAVGIMLAGVAMAAGVFMSLVGGPSALSEDQIGSALTDLRAAFAEIDVQPNLMGFAVAVLLVVGSINVALAVNDPSQQATAQSEVSNQSWAWSISFISIGFAASQVAIAALLCVVATPGAAITTTLIVVLASATVAVAATTTTSSGTRAESARSRQNSRAQINNITQRLGRLGFTSLTDPAEQTVESRRTPSAAMGAIVSRALVLGAFDLVVLALLVAALIAGSDGTIKATAVIAVALVFAYCTGVVGYSYYATYIRWTGATVSRGREARALKWIVRVLEFVAAGSAIGFGWGTGQEGFPFIVLGVTALAPAPAWLVLWLTRPGCPPRGGRLARTRCVQWFGASFWQSVVDTLDARKQQASVDLARLAERSTRPSIPSHRHSTAASVSAAMKERR